MNTIRSVLLFLILIPAQLCSASEVNSEIISVTEHIVFDGLEGWEKDGITYRLACGALLVEAPNGDLLCTWLSGTDSEPATDNCVLMARSADKGNTWDEPEILIPAGEMAGAVTSLYPTSDGRLILFGAHWPSEAEYTIWHYFRMESKDSGHTWSKPQPLTVHDNHACFGGPVHLANGELLFPVSFFEKREKPLVGPVMALAQTKSEEEALAVPASEGGYPGGKFSSHLHGSSVLIASDENATDLKEYGAIDNRPLGLLEPTCIQLKDGRIVMLMRAEFGGFLWRAESSDNGRTWSEAWRTDIPNPTSLASLIRLEDGRIALLHNAVGGVVGARGPRDPLSIWISEDEMESWSIKADVIHGGYLAYPNPKILDGELVFAYDHNRRQIRFVEVSIAN
ncbi:MAG: exo-alpha-sialidase [Candidatus Omnitrophica bacterium]|nr:exo-alpha-sialidase [Candidatus Omnitrophota bacterium]MCB9784454.1 exo-alpha-sialidase [Candidatus Omnitrophota bacterium]